jgi:DNA-directed RNA polymerase specialized sigma24 family protein
MTDDPFVSHRSLLLIVANEMLGSAADAEDVVQETWLRWADVDQVEVRDPRAYLESYSAESCAPSRAGPPLCPSWA